VYAWLCMCAYVVATAFSHVESYWQQHQKLETLRKEIAKLKLVKEQAENVLTPEDLKKILPGPFTRNLHF